MDNSKKALEISDSVKDENNSSPNEDDLILNFAEQAFYLIPNHGKVSPEAKTYMTSDLYKALSLAWDVPVWGDGEIGREEFLFYFITGNDPSDKQKVKSAQLMYALDGRYIVNVKYLEYWGDTPADDTSSILLVLVKENGDFILDDFGSLGDDGMRTKERCEQYISQEINDYLSGKTVGYMKSNQQGDWYTNEHIEKVIHAFNSYINQHQNYLSGLNGLDKKINDLDQNYNAEFSYENQNKFEPKNYEEFWETMVPMWKNNRIKAKKTYGLNTEMKLALGIDKVVECSTEWKYKLISQGGLDDFFIGYTNDDSFIELDYPCYVYVKGIFDEFDAEPYNFGSREERYYYFLDLKLDAKSNN